MAIVLSRYASGSTKFRDGQPENRKVIAPLMLLSHIAIPSCQRKRRNTQSVQTLYQDPLQARLDETGLYVATRGHNELGLANSNGPILLTHPLREVVVFHDRDILEATKRFKGRMPYEKSIVAEEYRVARMIIVPNTQV